MFQIDRVCFSAIIISIRLVTLLAVFLVPFMLVLPVLADWGPDVDLVATESLVPEIDAAGNFVHLVYSDYRTGDAEVYYRRSADFGNTWGADVRLTNDPNTSWGPDIEVSGQTVHVAYADDRLGVDQVYYRRSGDSGATWSAETMLSSAPASGTAPRLYSSGRNVYITWESDSGAAADIAFRCSTDDGITWGAEQRINQTAGTAESPDIGAWGGNVSIVWADSRSGTSHTYFQQSLDFGQTWLAADVALTSGGTSCRAATVVVTGLATSVVYMKLPVSGAELWSRSFNGLTWGAPTRFDSGAGPAINPTITPLGNVVHVAWLDKRDGGNWQVYYKRSADGGQSWGSDARLTTAAVAYEGYPTIGAASGKVYIAWADQRVSPPNNRIFFKKFEGSVPTATVFTPLDTVSFITSGGGISGMTALPSANLPCAPAGYIFPYGMFSYNIVELVPGQTVQVTVTFPHAIPSDAKYFKCQNGNAIDCSNFITRVDERTIILTLTDGGAGDADGVANGVIVDPGGPGFPLSSPQSSSATMPHAQQSPVSLSNIMVRDAALSATRVTPGTPVTVTASVANTGTGNGTAVIKVYVNGQEDASRGVAVNSGGATQIDFDITRNEPGTYTVYVNGTQAGSFSVDQYTPDTILFISGALVFLAFVLGVIYIARRSR